MQQIRRLASVSLTCLLIATGIGAVAQTASAATLESCAPTGTLPANDDGSSGLVPVGFTLNFFSQNYSNLYVNNNGNVTFTGALGAFTPQLIEATGTRIIAPYWADVDTRPVESAVTTYGTTTFQGRPAFCVDWNGVGYFGLHTDKLNRFQLLLVDRSDIDSGDFDIVFVYQQVQWETGDASEGIGGLGGFSARAGYSNGVASSYELPGSGVSGAFLDDNTSTGLVYGSEGGGTPGQYIYPVRNGSPFAADVSLTKTAQPEPVTVGDQLTYTLAVHNAGPNDAADVEVTDTLPAGVSFDSADAGCTEEAGTVTCSIASIPSDGDETRHIVVVPTEATAELSNTATVTAAGDPDLDNNTSTATSEVLPDSCPTSAPHAPGTPTAFGGNTTAAVSWTAPSTGPTPDTYTLFVHHGEDTTSIEGITDTQVQVNGLTNGETYSFTVAGVNCAGTGPESGASNDVTPASGSSAEVIGPGNLSQETSPGLPTTNVPEIGAQQFPTGTTGIGTVQLLQNSASARVPTLNFCNGVPCLGFVVEHKLLNGTVGGRPSGKVFYSSRIIYDRTLATGTGTTFKVWYDGNLDDDDTVGGDPTPPRLLPRCGSTPYRPVACVAKIERLASRDLKVVVRTSEIDPRIGVR